MNTIIRTCIVLFIAIVLSVCYLSDTFASGNITAAEYSLDCGSKSPYAATWYPLLSKDGSFDSDKEDVEFTPDISSLKFGLHALCIRMLNADGWGTPRRVAFEVKGEKYISGFEYFIGLPDPGAGKGQSIAVSDCTNERSLETALAYIDTSTLSPGIHTLYVRAQDSEGHWGTTRKYRFEVVEGSFPSTIISAAEFYMDSDPGQGDGIPMNAEDGSFSSSSENLIGLLDTSSLDIGLYTLYVRGMDSYGRWGVEKNICFEVVPPDPIPPETFITDGPSGIICSQNITFEYTGSDNITPKPHLVYATYLQGYDGGWSAFSPSTSITYEGLPIESYTFQVKAKDEAGNEDLSPATWPFEVRRILGDLNTDCKIDISDVILVLRCALELDICSSCGDMNSDGLVDISDVILTLRCALELDVCNIPCNNL